MNQLPEFWRTEIWHPLSVHYPIALLLIAFLFKIFSLKSKANKWEYPGSLLLYAGTLGAWLAIFTGNLAEGIVSRQICDPTILKDHENAAYIVAWLFSAASVLDVILYTNLLPNKWHRLKILVFILMFAGSGCLIYVGHLGATLVYQQGAGVYKPSMDCSEF